jgi:hypothetical protein
MSSCLFKPVGQTRTRVDESGAQMSLAFFIDSHSLLSVLSWFKCWWETRWCKYSLSRYDSLETEQKSVCYIFIWVYTHLCTVTGDWAHCIFVWLSNRPIGIVEMKRATTSSDKGFNIHDKVQFNIKQKFFCDFEVFRVSRPIILTYYMK